MATSKIDPAELSERSTELGISVDAANQIIGELAKLIADVFTLYLKTKNFHWHITGGHFRTYHLLLDEQADQIFAKVDPVAERARKLGGGTIRSKSDISNHQRLMDNNKKSINPHDMLLELRDDNRDLAQFLRVVHEMCGKYRDAGTAGLIEIWIDETERRTWLSSETVGGV